jgi:uncharacterized protein YecE (DUF72 family)
VSTYRVGTSGYNYPEWKGSFYPADLAAAKMLRYYAERFSTVEINYTFYRMPNEKTVTGWAAQTPEEFTFTLKAPRRITHLSKLRGTADTVRFFCDVAAKLGPKLGVLLFQLAPTFKKDLGVFDDFLATLPSGTRAAFEFRIRHGRPTTCMSACARAISLCASPTPSGARRRSWSPPTTRTSACATRATPSRTSRAGRRRSPSGRPA